MRIGQFWCFLVLVATCSRAEVALPTLFSNHLILQQETRNAIWGRAEPTEEVVVTASWGAEASAVADDEGDWKVMLETPAHGTGHQLMIQGSNRIEITDVAIGEVWLCAGQSNMGWALRNTFSGEQAVASADAPGFRIYKSAREHWHEPLKTSRDLLAKWSLCTPDSAAATSAVSYWFGKKLHDELGIPVGIIVQAYAGTPIEGWMPWSVQQDNDRSLNRKSDLDSKPKRVTREDALAQFEQELQVYRDKIGRGETMKNKVRPLAPPTITKPQALGNQYPANIDHAMIHPIRPYGIRGALWYQGNASLDMIPDTALEAQRVKSILIVLSKHRCQK